MRFPITHRRGFTNSDYRYADRNNYWSAWQNNGDISIGGPLRSDLIGSLTGNNATGVYYPQPMLSSIEFDGMALCISIARPLRRSGVTIIILKRVTLQEKHIVCFPPVKCCVLVKPVLYGLWKTLLQLLLQALHHNSWSCR